MSGRTVIDDDDEITDREPAPLGDADLVLRTRSGDKAAFGELWRRHYRSGITVARNISPGVDPDDLVQEAYTRIYHSIVKGGGPTGSFRAYLFTSIRNTAAGWGRSSRETSIDELESIEDPSTTDQATEESLDRGLTHQAFRSLPTRWQEVLWYSEIEAMKPAEIAPLLGMKATAVAQLTFRAREGLREAWIQAHLRTVVEGSDCAWSIERLGAYSRNNIGRRDRAKLEGHLSGCTRCAIVASEAREVSSRLALVLIPLTVGVTGAAGYLATLQGGAAPVAALAAMPPAVTGAGSSLMVGGTAGASSATVGAGTVGTVGLTAGAGSAAAATATGGVLSAAGIAGFAATGLVVVGTVVAGAIALPPQDIGELQAGAIVEASDPVSETAADSLLAPVTDDTLPIADADGPAPDDIPAMPPETDGDAATEADADAAAPADGTAPGAQAAPAAGTGSDPAQPGPSPGADPVTGANAGTPHSGNANSGSGNNSATLPALPAQAAAFTAPSILSSSSSLSDTQTSVQLTVAGLPGAVVQARLRGAVAGVTTIGPDGQATLTINPSATDLQQDARVELRYVEGGPRGAMASARLSELL